MAFRVAFGFQTWAWAAAIGLAIGSASAAEPPAVKRIAAIVSVYYHNSHADVIVSRLLEGDTLDGQGREIRLKLVSLYIDQTPENDKGRKLAFAWLRPRRR